MSRHPDRSRSCILWAVSVRIRDVSFIDSFWAFGMVMLAISTFVQAHDGIAAPQIPDRWVDQPSGACASHSTSYTRWRAEGEDPRYKPHSWKRDGKKGLVLRQIVAHPGIPDAGAVAVSSSACPRSLGQLAAEPAQTGWLAFAGKCLALHRHRLRNDRRLAVAALQAPIRQARARCSIPGCGATPAIPITFGDACVWWGHLADRGGDIRLAYGRCRGQSSSPGS